MRDRRDPWKWPATAGLTMALVGAIIFVLPRSWLDFLLAPQAAITAAAGERAQDVLLLLPPLVVEIEAPPVAPEIKEVPLTPVSAADPRWWTKGWAVETVRDKALFTGPSAVARDTVAVVLQALGVGADLLTRAQPDSVLAARLFLLQVEDNFRYEELKPYLAQMARSRAYAAIMARAADMYGEHLSQEIQVPK